VIYHSFAANAILDSLPGQIPDFAKPHPATGTARAALTTIISIT
jgi:hypothetical protein